MPNPIPVYLSTDSHECQECFRPCDFCHGDICIENDEYIRFEQGEYACEKCFPKLIEP